MERKGSSLKSLWYFLGSYKKRMGLLVFLCLVIGYLETMNVAILYPILTASLDMNAGLTSNLFIGVLQNMSELIPTGNIIISNCILFILLAVLVFLTRYLYVNISARTTANITVHYKNKVFEKFTRSDYQFFVDNRQGDLHYKATGAPESIPLIIDRLSKMTVEVIVGISLLVLIISISWKATLLVALGGVAYFYFARYLGFRVAYTAGQKIRVFTEEENVIINEYVSGIKQIITARTFPQWTGRFQNAVKARWQAWTKNKVWTEIPPYVLEFLLYAGVAAVIIGILIFYTDSFMIMIPMFGTFAFAMFRLFPSLSAAGRQFMQTLNLLPHLEATKDVLEDSNYTKVRNGTKKFNGLQAGMEFKGVCFAHRHKGSATVTNVSLTVSKNQTTAIVGPSGAGKSTIINLLLRLYDVDSGTILIDGTDIKEYDLASFLARVGFVSQETFIYNTSIKENITFGDSYGLDEVIEAAKLANAHDFIEQMQQGYETVVGDQGLRLSGGERQRLAIARAMIRKPQLLVLDEATSALDNVAERVVQEAIDRVSESCTTLVVAHRLSTIQRADIIYVLDRGKVVESGKHTELLKSGGKYSLLYSTQK